MNERKAVTREYLPRYQKASKKEKKSLLDEFTTLTGYHRKYATRILGTKPVKQVFLLIDGNQVKLTPEKKRPANRKGKRVYSDEVIECLRRVWTFEALSDIKLSIPFPVLELHSDNGSEFINNATEIWCKRNDITFTRSRDQKKNDNCFIEQKNSAVVREYVGYDRLEGDKERALITAVYRPLLPLLNFFMPTQKLKTKIRVGSKEIRTYDEPRSPFRRLMESTELPEKTKDSLRVQFALYNPVELQDNVNKAILSLRRRLAQPGRLITSDSFLFR